MTDNRTDGNTTRRRRPSSSKAGPLTASMVAAVRPVEPAAPAAPVEMVPAPVVEQPKPTKNKYTANLSETVALAFDELAIAARRAKGRPVDKSELLAAFVMLVADDAALREQVFGLLPEQGRRGTYKR